MCKCGAERRELRSRLVAPFFGTIRSKRSFAREPAILPWEFRKLGSSMAKLFACRWLWSLGTGELQLHFGHSGSDFDRQPAGIELRIPFRN